MTARDFTLWFKGFVTACNEFQPTPKQWDEIKEVLNSVEELKSISYTLNIEDLPNNVTVTAGNTATKVLLKD